jgi:hypothetical protein
MLKFLAENRCKLGNKHAEVKSGQGYLIGDLRYLLGFKNWFQPQWVDRKTELQQGDADNDVLMAENRRAITA